MPDVPVGTKPVVSPTAGQYLMGVDTTGPTAKVNLFPVDSILD